MVYRLACFLSMLLMAPAYASLMAELCRSEACHDPKFPLIDYADGNCFCSQHPCWDDNGQQHYCGEDSGYPFLAMRYTEEGELKCECTVRPQYQSTYISKVKCAGHSCDNDEHAILDFVDDKCVCRSHPCDDINGVKHTCDADSGYPLMTYREETVDGQLRPICDCRASVSKKPDEL